MSLAVLGFLTATSATAQALSHEVRVTIPEVIGIRIVGEGTGPRRVSFDFASNPDAYLSAVEVGGSLAPTAVARFDDVEVNVTRRGRWRVHVVATAFTYTGPASASGLELSDVRVERNRPQEAIVGPGNSATYAATWPLTSSATEIASRTGATGGWQSLGFSGWDYRLTVDGDEAPGTYATVVTYSLTAP